ncbi:MAG TPA: hypoxanthine phosphoribosyltransferase [Candidatus Hydrogenedentes bacterium]|nr:hypoxanthine phosphoribosyltransferase [Candidatus Hydrogenedentota bacterium]
MRLGGLPLIPAEQIQNRVRELGAQITRQYKGSELSLVVVLKGAIVFASDLMRALDVDVSLNFIRARSYAGTESKGTVSFTLLPDMMLEDRQVLVVEDILDTGRTCTEVMQWISKHRPTSIRLCALLDKPDRRVIPVEADFKGFVIEDHFVVGYGLDFEERYRNLPAIHVMEA